MRRALGSSLMLALVGACDYWFAPAAGAAAEPMAAPPALAAPAPPASGVTRDPARSVPQPDLVTPDCIGVADHLVGLSIAAIADPVEQANQASTRAKSVRATAESCTRGGWTPAVIRCFATATAPADLEPCNRLVMALPSSR